MTGMETLAHRFECPRCGAATGAPCADVVAVLHVERFDLARASVVAEHGPQMMPAVACSRCGQMSDAHGICQPCRESDRQPQGEAVRLFQPAPNQISGQLGMESEGWIRDYNAVSKGRLDYRAHLSDL